MRSGTICAWPIQASPPHRSRRASARSRPSSSPQSPQSPRPPRRHRDDRPARRPREPPQDALGREVPDDLRRRPHDHLGDGHDRAARRGARDPRQGRRRHRRRRARQDPARGRGRRSRHRAVDDPRVRPQRRARHGARRLQLVLRYGLGPHEHLRLRDARAPSERPRRHGAHGAPLRRPPQHRLHHVGRAPARHRGLRLLPRVLPRHGQQHDQADGHDRRRRRGPRGHVEDRLGLPRRRRAAAREAVLHPVRRARQPAAARPRGARQAALLRRLGHPAHLLPGADRRRHGADHPRRPHRAGRGRVALRRRHPPAAPSRLPAAHRHGPGQARHEHRPGALQLGRVLHHLPRHHRDGQVDGHPQLGLRRHQRLAVRRRQRRHRHHRAHAALDAGRLEPQPRHRLPRLRPHRRRRARRAHRRGHLDEPARARGHRGQRGDAGPRRHRRGRPGRRLPRPEAHQAARAEPAVAADDPQSQHAEELGGRRLARRHREGAPQARGHHDQPHARAAERRA